MKCIHFLRDKGYKDQPIDICTNKLLNTIEIVSQSSRKANLEMIREYDRHHIYKPSVNDFL